LDVQVTMGISREKKDAACASQGKGDKSVFSYHQRALVTLGKPCAAMDTVSAKGPKLTRVRVRLRKGDNVSRRR